MRAVGGPAEFFGADVGYGLVVGVFAAVYEGESEVDVLLFLENKSAEDEISAVKAGNCVRSVSVTHAVELVLTMLRVGDGILSIVICQEGEVWTRRGMLGKICNA